jgi:Flp pilus assembly protein CpaB
MASLIGQLPEPVRGLLHAASWHRRLLASGCAAAAVAFALSALAPKPPAVVSVLAAARDVPAGAVLTAADVHTIGLPPAVVPHGALRAGTPVVGRVVAAAMQRDEPLTAVRLVGRSLFTAVGDGKVATPVRIADPGVARLLQPGDVVDVLAATDHGPGPTALTVAAGARVLAVPQPTTNAGLDDGALVVLATTPSAAAVLARAASVARLSVVVHGQ